MGQPEIDPFIEHSLRTSMFFPVTRLFVAGNPKCAGTTLRWWLLSVHGVDVAERTRNSWWGESAPFQTVWDSGVELDFTWRDLSPSRREDALTSADVLTVNPTRHPVSRLFSAWSGKYLIDEPYYEDRLPEGFARLPASIDSDSQITELFERFTSDLRSFVDANGFEQVDVHFWPQHRLLGRHPVGEVLVLRQESMTDGLTAIANHLSEHGLTPGEAPRINETVVAYRGDLVTDAALTNAKALYAEDFAKYDYPEERPADSSRAARGIDLDWLNDVRGRNARYGVIHRNLTRLQRENDELRDVTAQARSREDELMETTSWKVTGPLRWVSDKTKR
jgi:hypothetical protein